LIGMPTVHERTSATAAKQTVRVQTRRVVTPHRPRVDLIRT
jgi:hypothetical protein